MWSGSPGDVAQQRHLRHAVRRPRARLSVASDSSHFEDKEWTPIWRDYTTVQGMLHLPKPVSMSYLKLGSPSDRRPYPIYKTGNP